MPKMPTLHASMLGLTSVLALTLNMPPANGAQDGDRSGRKVVDEVCVECHGPGTNDAPRIGDREAWRLRASQGLTALTEHALKGIRQMPAHGGQPQLTDLEIARAVTYMVNQSGGAWVAPSNVGAMTGDQAGREIVDAYCSQCHETGVGGAPGIGDREAWIPRLRQGLPYAVRSAVNGHGGMPPRGGAASLTDREIRNAIIYMFNPEASLAGRAADRQTGMRTVSTDGNHASVHGMDIYLGLMPAERLRQFPAQSAERSMHGGVPKGREWHHLNVSLLDQATRAPVDDAQVAVEIIQAGRATVSRMLERMDMGPGSYGDYFRIDPDSAYRIIVSMEAPEAPRRIEAEFAHQAGTSQ